MPNEPLIVAHFADAVDSLGKMTRANGFWFDYGPVEVGGEPVFDLEPDLDRPTVHVRWEGEIETESTTGAESAAGRFRHYDRFVAGVALLSDDVGGLWQRVSRIRADFHRALIATDSTVGLSRERNASRVVTYDAGNSEFFLVLSQDGTRIVGGVMEWAFVIRWDHVTGDMGSQ